MSLVFVHVKACAVVGSTTRGHERVSGLFHAGTERLLWWNPLVLRYHLMPGPVASLPLSTPVSSLLSPALDTFERRTPLFFFSSFSHKNSHRCPMTYLAFVVSHQTKFPSPPPASHQPHFFYILHSGLSTLTKKLCFSLIIACLHEPCPPFCLSCLPLRVGWKLFFTQPSLFTHLLSPLYSLLCGNSFICL